MLDDFVNPAGKRLQVRVRARDDELIVDPSHDLKFARHPVRITDGADKIGDTIPSHRVLVELTGFSEAKIVSAADYTGLLD